MGNRRGETRRGIVLGNAGITGNVAGGDAAVVLIILLLVLALVGLHIWALVDSIVRPDWAYTQARSSKVLWILLNVFLGLLASVIYLIAIRPKVIAAQRQGSYIPSWPSQTPGAAWFPDPTGRHELRYWNGFAWTDSVSDRGYTAHDPISTPVRSSLGFHPRALGGHLTVAPEPTWSWVSPPRGLPSAARALRRSPWRCRCAREMLRANG